MKIGIDLDGVCYDFNKSYRNYIINAGVVDADHPMDGPSWTFYKDWGWTDEQFMQHFVDGVNKRIIFGGGALYTHPGTREGLQHILDMGHSLHVITDRSIGLPGYSASLTLEWMESELPKPISSVTFTRDKTTVAVDMMIDDKIENYDDLRAVGVECILFDRPWNQRGDDGRARVRDMNGFVNAVAARTLQYAAI